MNLKRDLLIWLGAVAVVSISICLGLVRSHRHAQHLPLEKSGYGMISDLYVTNDGRGGTFFYTTNVWKLKSPFNDGFDLGFEAGVQSAIQAHLRFLKHAETLGDNPPTMINVELWRHWSLSIWTNRPGAERTR